MPLQATGPKLPDLSSSDDGTGSLRYSSASKSPCTASQWTVWSGTLMFHLTLQGSQSTAQHIILSVAASTFYNFKGFIVKCCWAILLPVSMKPLGRIAFQTPQIRPLRRSLFQFSLESSQPGDLRHLDVGGPVMRDAQSQKEQESGRHDLLSTQNKPGKER